MGLQLPIEAQPVVASAEYPVRIVGYKGDIPGKYGPMIRVSGIIIEGQYTNVEVSKLFGQRLTPRCELASFLKALDIPLPDQIGARIDLDQMINKQLIAGVEANETDKNVYNNMVSFRRWLAPAAGTSIAPQHAPPPAQPVTQPAYVPPTPAAIPTTPQPQATVTQPVVSNQVLNRPQF